MSMKNEWNGRDPKLRISTTKAQELLLKLAKQQRELANLRFENVDFKNRLAEWADRWNKVRDAVKAPSDATVPEVLDRVVFLYATADREVIKDLSTPACASDGGQEIDLGTTGMAKE
jgi:hypothetical protein